MLDRSYFGRPPEHFVDDNGWLVVCEPNPEEAELLVSLGIDPDTVDVGHKGRHHFLVPCRQTEATVRFLCEITNL